MNEQIKSYIEKILGISVQFHHWKGELELPFYITERYDMRLAELDDSLYFSQSEEKAESDWFA